MSEELLKDKIAGWIGQAPKPERKKVDAVVAPPPVSPKMVVYDHTEDDRHVPMMVAEKFDETNFPSKADGFFILVDAAKGKWAPDYEGFAGYIAQKYYVRSVDGVSYRFADGYYRSITGLEFLNLAYGYMRINTPPRVIRAMVEAAEIKTFTAPEGMKAPVGKINLANGILNLRDRTLEAHSAKYFFKYKLPHKYLPEAKCPNWINFLRQTFDGNEDLVNLSAEIFGWVLMGGPPKIHTSIFLQGEGRNGKGVFLDTLKAIIGEGNYSAIALDKLDQPFSVVHCDGKLANIVTEVTTKAIESATFKTAVSGEEVMGAFKHRDEFKFPFHARIIMAANKIPYMGDTTTGTHEKFLILPFNRYIARGERDIDFLQHNIMPEMSGILNWALEGLERIAKRRAFSEVAAVLESVEEMREEVDAVYRWFKSHVLISEKVPVSILTFGPIYPEFVTWCEKEGIKAVPRHIFCRKCTAEVRKNTNLKITKPQNVVTVSGRIKLVKSGI
jgi:P4 family phage/plasmid primase-like protien